jgi:hypothetical protein
MVCVDSSRHGGTTQTPFPLARFLGEIMTDKSLIPSHFSCAGETETLCGTTITFHLWHKDGSYLYLAPAEWL